MPREETGNDNRGPEGIEVPLPFLFGFRFGIEVGNIEVLAISVENVRHLLKIVQAAFSKRKTIPQAGLCKEGF